MADPTALSALDGALNLPGSLADAQKRAVAGAFALALASCAVTPEYHAWAVDFFADLCLRQLGVSGDAWRGLEALLGPPPGGAAAADAPPPGAAPSDDSPFLTDISPDAAVRARILADVML